MNPDVVSLIVQVMRRHIIPHQVIELENRAPGGPELRYQSDTGEDIVIRKDNDNGRFTITSPYNILCYNPDLDIMLWLLNRYNASPPFTTHFVITLTWISCCGS